MYHESLVLKMIMISYIFIILKNICFVNKCKIKLHSFFVCYRNFRIILSRGGSVSRPLSLTTAILNGGLKTVHILIGSFPLVSLSTAGVRKCDHCWDPWN